MGLDVGQAWGQARGAQADHGVCGVDVACAVADGFESVSKKSDGRRQERGRSATPNG